MNYYIPYGNIPYNIPAKTGILSGIIKKGINFSSILTNTQKTLNIINQSIPAIKQVKPLITNAKTMFKVMNEFKKVDEKPKKNNIESKKNQSLNKATLNNSTSTPTFFA